MKTIIFKDLDEQRRRSRGEDVGGILRRRELDGDYARDRASDRPPTTDEELELVIAYKADRARRDAPRVRRAKRAMAFIAAIRDDIIRPSGNLRAQLDRT